MKIKTITIVTAIILMCYRNVMADNNPDVTITSPSSSQDQYITNNQALNFECNATGGCSPYTYQWSFGTGASQSSSSSQKPGNITYSDALSGNQTTATVKVTDAAGNTNEDSVTIIMLSLDSKTKSFAPDGTDDSRDTIGVGEMVDLTITPLGLNPQWSVTSNGQINDNGDSTATLTAGNTANIVTCTAVIQGVTLSNSFNVVAPSQLNATKFSSTSTTGFTSQFIKITVTPRNVSFDRVMWSENACPPVSVTGYFANYQIRTGDSLVHSPTGSGSGASYITFYNNDVFDSDVGRFPSPYSSGYFEWHIPTLWITVDDYNYGDPVTSRTPFNQSPIRQSFSMDNDGIITISKLNISTP